MINGSYYFVKFTLEQNASRKELTCTYVHRLRSEVGWPIEYGTAPAEPFYIYWEKERSPWPLGLRCFEIGLRFILRLLNSHQKFTAKNISLWLGYLLVV
jgi:hypothetical protein